MCIILIGPVGIGKSTIGSLLSKKLKVEVISLDDLYKEELRGKNSVSEESRIYTVKRAIKEYSEKNCILDFGAFHSVFLFNEKLNREVEEILKPINNVIYLVPSEDKINSKKHLFKFNKSCQKFIPDDLKRIREQNNNILDCNQNEMLAKKTVYTKGKNIEEIAEEIIKIIS